MKELCIRIKCLFCIFASVCLFSLFSCDDYDDAWIKDSIKDLQERVASLESWCETANNNISSLQTLVDAMNKHDFITGVSPVVDNGKEIGFAISFKISPSIVIYHGKDGANGMTPVIGAKKGEDGKYYWTQTFGDDDPVFILDEGGNKITTTQIAPKLNIDSDGYWMIDTNGEGFVRMKDANGNDVKAVGEKGDKGDKGDTGSTGASGSQGDAIFKKDGIDLSNPSEVTFELSDGTKITFPRANTGIIDFESYEEHKITKSLPNTIPLILSLNADSYKGIMATIETTDGTFVDIQTKSSNTSWNVSVSKPEFNSKGEVTKQPVITVIVANDIPVDTKAVLTVSVITSTGDKVSVSCMLSVSTLATEIPANGEISEIGHLFYLSEQTNNGSLNTQGKTYTLVNNIDLQNIEFKPIKNFEGVLNGQGHTISNLFVKNTGEVKHIGLFGAISTTAKVCNLNVNGSIEKAVNNPEGDPCGVAGVVGFNQGTVSNCTFSGLIINTPDFNYTGGVVGYNTGTIIGSAYLASDGGKIASDNGQGCGGIVGCNNSGSYVIACYNTGNINPTGNSWNLGGIAGINDGNIVACYNLGEIQGVASTCNGGITGGAFSDNTVTSCFNVRNLELGKAAYMIDGTTGSSSVLTSCYWLDGLMSDGYSEKANSTDCMAKTEEELKSQETVDALNQAIETWNASNENRCTYRYVVNPTGYPQLEKLIDNK